MNSFLQTVSSLCSAMIFVGGMLLITPAKSQRSMRFILSLVLILVLCSSVSCDSAPRINLPDMSSNDFSSTLADTAANQTVEAYLKDNQINYSALKVYTTKTDDGSIIISRIELSTKEHDADVAGMLKFQFPSAEVAAEYE